MKAMIAKSKRGDLLKKLFTLDEIELICAVFKFSLQNQNEPVQNEIDMLQEFELLRKELHEGKRD